MPWLPILTLTGVLPPAALTRRFCLSQPGASSPKMWSKPEHVAADSVPGHARG